MNEEYLNYEESKELEKLGFDAFTTDVWLSPSNHKVQHGMMNYPKAIFRDVVSAPLYQQAFRWFREKHNLVFNFISYNIVKPGEYHWSITWNDEAKAGGIVKTYEEAELECLIKLIEIVNTKKD